MFARALIEIANEPCEMLCGESGGGTAGSCECGELSGVGVVDGRTVAGVCEIVEFAVWGMGFVFETMVKPDAGESVDVSGMGDGSALD